MSPHDTLHDASTPGARVGFCCKFIPETGDKAEAKRMNITIVTMAYLARQEPMAAFEKLVQVVSHNLEALHRQIAWVAARPPAERLLRLASQLFPGYTYPAVMGMYRDPVLRDLIETRLAAAGDLARAGDVRLSLHPGPFCVLATESAAALKNALDELEYHAEIMAMMGYDGGWHPHGAHINIHTGARAPGIEVFRENLAKASQTARNLVTVENDETSYGLDALLPLTDTLPIVLDLHHHWIASGGEYIEPDDPRIGRVIESWRGVRPIAHISVSREDLLVDHAPGTRPDFAALTAAGITAKDLRAHSDMMWNEAVNALVARHLAWADFEVEAKFKNLASGGLARAVRGVLALPAEDAVIEAPIPPFADAAE